MSSAKSQTIPCFPISSSHNDTRVRLNCGHCHRITDLPEVLPKDQKPKRYFDEFDPEELGVYAEDEESDLDSWDGDPCTPRNDPTYTRCPCGHRHDNDTDIPGESDCQNCQYTAFFPLVVCFACENRQPVVWSGTGERAAPTCNRCDLSVDSSWLVCWEASRFVAKMLETEYMWCQVESAVVYDTVWGETAKAEERVSMKVPKDLAIWEVNSEWWDEIAQIWWKGDW